MKPHGRYKQRRPRKGEERRAAQEVFISLFAKLS
jgi:hypothetical protein